jgi:hypothetical protein
VNDTNLSMQFLSSVQKKTQGTLLSIDNNRRLLIVDVLEARNLLPCDKKKGTSDAYIICSLLDLGDREIRAETFSTQHVKGTINPSYNQKFSFGTSCLLFDFL